MRYYRFTALEQGLRLLHPMMPFITEELYQRLPEWADKKMSISIAPYPREIVEWSEKGAAINEKSEFLIKVIKQIRTLGSSVNLSPSAKPDVVLVFLKGAENTERLKKLIHDQSELILTLSKAKQVNKKVLL